jgi:hypothetical protein
LVRGTLFGTTMTRTGSGPVEAAMASRVAWSSASTARMTSSFSAG